MSNEASPALAGQRAETSCWSRWRSAGSRSRRSSWSSAVRRTSSRLPAATSDLGSRRRRHLDRRPITVPRLDPGPTRSSTRLRGRALRADGRGCPRSQHWLFTIGVMSLRYIAGSWLRAGYLRLDPADRRRARKRLLQPACRRWHCGGDARRRAARAWCSLAKVSGPSWRSSTTSGRQWCWLLAAAITLPVWHWWLEWVERAVDELALRHRLSASGSRSCCGSRRARGPRSAAVGSRPGGDDRHPGALQGELCAHRAGCDRGSGTARCRRRQVEPQGEPIRVAELDVAPELARDAGAGDRPARSTTRARPSSRSCARSRLA